jgi:hypothetical protein
MVISIIWISEDQLIEIMNIEEKTI